VITKQTTFVLGAGSSKPYGLPLASELRRSILDMANTALEPYGISTNDVTAFQHAFKFSSQASIDAFLEYRKDYIPVGKYAIVSQVTKNQAGYARPLK
jgi:hypothetical protein